MLRNRLLRVLAPDDFALVAPHLRPVDLQLGSVVIAPDEPTTSCCFVEEGVVSVATVERPTRIELGLVGSEGLVGAMPVLLGDARAPYAHIVQVPGHGLAIPSQALRAAVSRSASLQHTLLAYIQTQVLQLAESIYAQAALNLEARLARWLLMCQDRVSGDAIALTHEFLSIMLGVQRAGVTLALQGLEGAGMIRGRRKRIEILDRGGLEGLTEGSYGVPEAAYARLIEGGRKGAAAEGFRPPPAA
ncbi:Crp/Fnr family transcriptional regulator [Methylobacterium dankookense]|nr:Crp/Fnr family transcriptional regulator [Methylobacterium dankookense]